MDSRKLTARVGCSRDRATHLLDLCTVALARRRALSPRRRRRPVSLAAAAAARAGRGPGRVQVMVLALPTPVRPDARPRSKKARALRTRTSHYYNSFLGGLLIVFLDTRLDRGNGPQRPKEGDSRAETRAAVPLQKRNATQSSAAAAGSDRRYRRTASSRRRRRRRRRWRRRHPRSAAGVARLACESASF